MAELDFSKIFGETATSKAEFTQENYVKGWGYLGSTPPPYQLFDYLQSQNDKKAKFLYDKVMSYEGQYNTHNTSSSAHADIRQLFKNYLPLTGGTLTGNVKFNNVSAGFNNRDNTYDTKIRIASNGDFDIGVTEDSANKNATTLLLLHSQNKPKWYNSAMGGKEIAITEDITNAITAVDNSNSLAKAPTLQLVKTLLSGLNIKNATDVIDALETNKTSELGIRYDFSNQNAWYICLGKLFGNLIVQGGRKQAGEQKQFDVNNLDGTTSRVVFPIAFKSKCLFHGFGIIASNTSLFWGNSSASVLVRRESLTDMRYAVHSDYQTMLKPDSIIEWCVVGV